MHFPKVLRRMLAVLVVVVLFDVGLSLTLLRDGHFGKRPLPPFGALTEPEQLSALDRIDRDEASPEGVTGFDRELGWTLRPLASHKSGEYHVNSQGVRSLREYDATPAPDVVRLACFGDSFVFGDEVKDEWTFESFLEERDPRLEALNFGVPAYGTDQALLRFRREGRHEACIVVLGVLLENIGRNVNRYRPLWYPRSRSPLCKPRFVLDAKGQLELLAQPFENAHQMADAVRDGSVIERLAKDEYWLGRPEVFTGRWSSFGRLIGGYFAYRERNPERLWLDRECEPRRVTLALIDRFRRDVLASGAKECLVLVFPERAELDAYAKTGREYWSELLVDLDRLHVPYLDLAPALADEQAHGPSDAKPWSVYFATHFSSVGNHRVAQEIFKWLAASEHRSLIRR